MKRWMYEFIILFTVGISFLMTGLLITPFVMIYTHGITDANYYQPLFGVILVLAEAMYLLRSPHVSLAYAANKFKEITAPAYIEAIINIVVSAVLIQRMGLIGIAIGTLIGMAYRGAFHVYFTAKLISSRPQRLFYMKLIKFLIPSILGIVICVKLFPITILTISSWIIHAIIYGIICGGLFLTFSFVYFRKELMQLKNYIKMK